MDLCHLCPHTRFFFQTQQVWGSAWVLSCRCDKGLLLSSFLERVQQDYWCQTFQAFWKSNFNFHSNELTVLMKHVCTDSCTVMALAFVKSRRDWNSHCDASKSPSHKREPLWFQRQLGPVKCTIQPKSCVFLLSLKSSTRKSSLPSGWIPSCLWAILAFFMWPLQLLRDY